MRQLVLEISPPKQATLENFIVGENLPALTLLEKWVRKEGEPNLYLWGPKGAGKTHLLEALHQQLLTNHYRVGFIRCTQTTHLEESTEDFLLIDDVQHLHRSGAISLFNRFNERREQQLPLLVCGDAPPHQLPLLPDLSTRLSWGLVLRLCPLSDEDKIKALQQQAINMGIELSRESASYLLSRWHRDIRSLLTLLDELNRWSLSLHKPITIPLIREALHTLREQPV